MSRERFPKLGKEIAGHVESFYRRRGCESAAELGDEVAELLLTLYAGERVAFPAQPFRWRDMARRNAEIRCSFDGHNAPELAQKYGLSRQSIWQIVASHTSTG